MVNNAAQAVSDLPGNIDTLAQYNKACEVDGTAIKFYSFPSINEIIIPGAVGALMVALGGFSYSQVKGASKAIAGLVIAGGLAAGGVSLYQLMKRMKYIAHDATPVIILTPEKIVVDGKTLRWTEVSKIFSKLDKKTTYSGKVTSGDFVKIHEHTDFTQRLFIDSNNHKFNSPITIHENFSGGVSSLDDLERLLKACYRSWGKPVSK